MVTVQVRNGGTASGDEIAERLARLVRIPTVSTGDDPADDAVFDDFMRELARCYPRTHERLTLERTGERGYLFTWMPDRDGADDAAADGSGRAGALLLLAHLDVVPAVEADGWTHPPFAAVRTGDRLQGRGTLDDKGPLVVIFEAVEALVREGFSPAAPLYLALGADEEANGRGARDTLDVLLARGVRPRLVLDEGGAVVDGLPPFLADQAAFIGIAEKGVATVELHAEGSPGHASTPTSGSPTARLARAVTAIDRCPFPARLTAPARGMLTTFAAQATGARRALLRLAARLPLVTAPLMSRVGGESAALVRTTCTATMLRAGTAPNVVAADATATLNLRLLPGETQASALRRLRRVIRDPQIRIRLVEGSDPTPISPQDGPEFELLQTALAASWPEAVATPYLVVATTDARHFHRHFPNVYRLAPLLMTATQRARIHGVDEDVDLDSLVRGTRFHDALIRAALGTPAAS